MTIPQAIAELDDRDLQDVIKVIQWLDSENKRMEKKIVRLYAENRKVRCGEF